MAEHVGRAKLPGYAGTLEALLRPGGRLLNHAISWAEEATTWDDDTFIARYVFPDGELVTLGDMINALTSGDLEVIDVETLRQHYALTLRAWVRNLEEHWDDAVAATSEGRARVWRLYMSASALAFEVGQAGREPGAAAEAGRRRRRRCAATGSEPGRLCRSGRLRWRVPDPPGALLRAADRTPIPEEEPTPGE